MKRAEADRRTGRGLAAIYVGLAVLQVLLAVLILRWPIPLGGKALFGLVGAFGAGFFISLWRWPVHAARTASPAHVGGLRFAIGPKPLDDEARHAWFWARMHLLCWWGGVLTILGAAVALGS